MDTLQAETETSNETEKAILADVRARFETTENPRIRQLILGLIDHLHAFVREQKVTWSEWEYFMGFLARAAAVTKDGRNEFIALSDSIGISMQVLAASQPKPPGATILNRQILDDMNATTLRDALRYAPGATVR